MISFNLFEAADSAQNLHLTHADEDIFERGDKGAKNSLEFIVDVAKNLGKGKTTLTVKWDGAPAIFAGWDPADGKFFVGTKGVFNKTPLLYKTAADVDARENGAKADKLKICLEELPKVGIPKGKVLQGDLLWTTGDLKYETIEGKRWITAHPNTIVYAWDADSAIGKTIRNARMGIVWHTTYSGRGSLDKFRASFGVDVKKLKQTRNCWMDDAYFKGADIAFSDNEFDLIMTNAQAASKLIGGFDKIVDIMGTIPSSAQGANVKTFINNAVRAGKLPDPEKALLDYYDYLKKYWDEKILSKLKTDKAKDQKKVALIQLLQEIQANAPVFQRAFEFVSLVNDAKMIIVKSLNKLDKQKSFVKTKKGFQVTAPEGFVAISASTGEAVKFVDRLSFSHFNFSDEYIKGWQK